MTQNRPEGHLPPQMPDATDPALPGQIESTPRKKGLGTAGKAGIAGLAVLALAGGFAVADPLDMRKSNAETAAAVMPADLVGFAEVDFDPSLGQKAEMVRFAMKFPALKEKVSLTEDGDLKQQLFEAAMKDGSCTSVNYEADVKPWLGNRMAMGVRQGSDHPVVAVEASDEAKAREGIKKLQACDDHSTNKDMGIAFADGYLVTAKDQAEADKVVTDAKASPLAERAEYKEDLDKVGEPGILNVWGTKEGLMELAKSDVVDEVEKSAPGSTATAASQLEQLDEMAFRSGAGSLRFTGGNPELVMATKSTKDVPVSKAVTAVGDLPKGTSVAFGVADGAAQLDQAWPELEKVFEQNDVKLADLEQQTKLKLPDDLKTLMGEDLRIAVGALDESQFEDPTKLPVAITSRTDAAKITEILERTGIAAQGITVKGTDEMPVLALNDAYAGEVVEAKEKLKDDGAFGAAVADADKAQSVVYLDLESFMPMMTKQMNESDRKNVEPLKAIGISSRTAEDNYGIGVVRVTAK